METEHGLTIHRSDHERGGFDVELIRPDDDDHEHRAYATLRYGDEGVWHTNRDHIRAQSLIDAINLVDRSYAGYRQQLAAAERQRREEREARTERVNPHWQQVIDTFGPKPDTAN